MTNKFILPFLIAGAATTAFAQVYTKPVGYEVLEKKVGVNFFGVRLLQQIEFSDTVASVSGTTVTHTATNELAGTNYLLEITSGAAEGTVIEIDSYTTSTITLTADLSADLAAGDSFDIRPAQTLATVFGENNEIGLNSTPSFASSDQVGLPDGSGGFTKYAYVAGFLTSPSAWKAEDGTTVDPSTIAINHTDALLIFASTDSDIVITGAVKESATTYALTDSVNFLGSVYPVGSTLASAFGANNEAGLTSSTSFANCDQISMLADDGTYASYAYVDGFLASPAAWKNENGGVIDPSTIELESGMIIKKGGVEQNITIVPASYYDNL